MNARKITKKLISIFILLLLMPVMASARSSNNNEICIDSSNGSNFYTVTHKGSKVSLFNISDADIKGTDKYPPKCFCSTVGDNCLKKENKKDNNGNIILDESGKPITTVTTECASEYQFEVNSQAKSCKVQERMDNSYNFIVCPDPNSANVVGDMQKSMEIKYDASSNKYKVTFSVPNNFKGKISAKLIGKTIKGKVSVFDINPEDGLPNKSKSIIGNYSASEVENGISFAPGTEFYFIFYLNDISDSCNNSRLGYIMGAVPSTVDNPMYSDKMCTEFRGKYASGSIERIIVSACDETTIQASELGTIRDTIQSKIKEVENIHKQIESSVSPTNNFTCSFENNSKTINAQTGFSSKTGFLDIAGTGTYWKALCTETISIEYDDPKAVKAGAGFNYNAKLVINRTCTPVKIAEPKYLPNCSYSVECWGGPANHSGEAGAGPNEDFDNCINTCDGGTYTQNCIDSCYTKIYKNSTTTSLFSNNNNKLTSPQYLTFDKINSKATRLSSNNKGNPNLIGTTDGGQTKLPISSGCVISGNDDTGAGCNTYCAGQSFCYTEHGIEFVYLNSCNANGTISGTKCYEVYTNWPCNDGANYEKDIRASEAEYNSVVAAIQEFSSSTIDNEKYQIIIDEDYNKQNNGNYLSKTIIFSNKNGDNRLYVNTKPTEKSAPTYVSNTNIANPTVGGLDQNFITEHINKTIYSYQISRTVEIGIGAAYVSKINGNDVIYNKSNSNTDSTLDKNNKYYSAQNKYFTQFDTRIINNYRNWPYYNFSIVSDSTANYTKNIHVRLYNIGSWNQWGTTGNGVNVDCLYGTAPGFVCPDDDCPDEEEEGIRYIFRPINLNDMFPNGRNPRFNWTGTIDKNNNSASGAAILKEKSYYNDAIDPETLIKTIESKGESIYNTSSDSSEIDYEFVLTRDNIRNIRSYNKNIRDYNGDGEKNYLDYNMSCYTNNRGQEICTSKFLDNINGNSGSEDNSNFITYSVSGYGITERKSIAGCNNAINGTECDTISK